MVWAPLSPPLIHYEPALYIQNYVQSSKQRRKGDRESYLAKGGAWGGKTLAKGPKT